MVSTDDGSTLIERLPNELLEKRLYGGELAIVSVRRLIMFESSNLIVLEVQRIDAILNWANHVGWIYSFVV